jgi:hypothetical protein
VELVLGHDAAQPKVRDHDVGVLGFREEKQVLRLEIAVDDAAVVDVFYGAENRADEGRGISGWLNHETIELVLRYERNPLFVVIAFGAYTVKELAAGT